MKEEKRKSRNKLVVVKIIHLANAMRWRLMSELSTTIQNFLSLSFSKVSSS